MIVCLFVFFKNCSSLSDFNRDRNYKSNYFDPHSFTLDKMDGNKILKSFFCDGNIHHQPDQLSHSLSNNFLNEPITFKVYFSILILLPIAFLGENA